MFAKWPLIDGTAGAVVLLLLFGGRLSLLGCWALGDAIASLRVLGVERGEYLFTYGKGRRKFCKARKIKVGLGTRRLQR